MPLFTNILVGVDPTHYNPSAGADQRPSVSEPIHWGVQLARANSARLLFFSASNVGPNALLGFTEEDRTQVLENLSQGGSKVLASLVRQARQEGVEADSKFVPGAGWLEIIHQVLQAKHDLVVVGTHDRTRLGHMLFGNTSMKLLRRCPCPVLVTRQSVSGGDVLGQALKAGPDASLPPLNILVATNLRPPSEQVLQMGIALAKQMNANLHVLHVVEYELHEVCNIGLPDIKQKLYRQRLKADAERKLHAELEATGYRALGSRIQVHLAGDVDLPDVAIQHFIESHQIHLLVMGTIAQGGIRGIMIGDTAERLLHHVGCSVLAVKPPDFVCPVDA